MTEHRVRSAQRRAVFERARGCCEYCRSQARFSTASFAAEHIVAIGDCNAQTGIGDPYLPFREVLG
ncbi:MAG: HNH endonuclease, partial [Anaerolineae bacterium]